MTSFTREVTLKRQGHVRGRSFTPIRPSLESNRPLNIIIEEDESRSSSPISCYSVSSCPEESSPNLTLKAKRRQATVVSDIRLSRVFPTDECLLSSPRPAPQPPTSFDPPPSPDSFKLKFIDLSLKFPHPPIPTPSSMRRHSECASPTSSLSSSPASQSDDMLLTPSTSDDEFSPPIMPRLRPVIQPLVITKHNPRPSSLFDDDCPISPSLLQPFKNPTESSAPLSPLSPSYLPEAFFDESDETFEDSDSESDSEWYSKELSKIISLHSPIPPSFPHQTSTRPDSIFIPSSEFPAPLKRRVSKPLPPTPLSGGFPSPHFPSPQLDPAFPQRKRRSLPKYPPPPVPTTPSTFLSPTPSPSCSSSFSRRPPPRSSIPADCVYDLLDIDDMKQDDDSSAFSFSIYDVYLDDEPLPSPYSQEGDAIDDVSFDLDCSMMLPLSLPATPLDLEADIAQGLEQLRNSPVDGQRHDFIIPEIREPEPEEQPLPPPQQQQQQQVVVDDIFSPTFPSDTTSPTSPSYPYTSAEEKVLKSRWSTSTFSSIHEEHENRGGASSKLLLYFSPLKNQKQGSKKSSTSTSPSHSSHKTPTSPTPSSSVRSPTRAHMRGQSDVMVIGYGNNGNGNGVRRRGSVSNNSVSDAGSDESYSSTSSSGLRRKPIPVEMFLRSGA